MAVNLGLPCKGQLWGPAWQLEGQLSIGCRTAKPVDPEGLNGETPDSETGLELTTGVTTLASGKVESNVQNARKE